MSVSLGGTEQPLREVVDAAFQIGGKTRTSGLIQAFRHANDEISQPVARLRTIRLRRQRYTRHNLQHLHSILKDRQEVCYISTNSTTNSHHSEMSDSILEIRLQAENYELAQAATVYRPHPEGFPRIDLNGLLLGYPGVGKTLMLKTLCYQKKDSPQVLPLYIRIEPWIATVEGETAGERDVRRSPREHELRICTRISLSLCFLAKVFKYAGFEAAKVGTSYFAAPPHTGNEFSDWVRQQTELLRRVLQNGVSLPMEYLPFPSLYAVVNTVGEAFMREGRRLVLLIDQVDRTSAFHFEGLASLLRRGDYNVIIATRPCPCAPDATPLLEATGGGHDFATHWIGTDARTPAWRTLLKDIVQRAPIRKDVRIWVKHHIVTLSSLLGPSTRSLLEFCLEMEKKRSARLPLQESWTSALRRQLDQHENFAATILGALCGEPTFFIDRLRAHALGSRQSAQRGPGPVALHLRSQSLINDGLPEEFLRVATREGLFFPLPRDSHGLDSLSLQYEPSPLLIAPRDPMALEHFDDSLIDSYVDLETFSKWIRTDPRHRTRQQKAVFVGRRIGAAGDGFVSRLNAALLGRARLITGENLQGSQQWAPGIRDLLKKQADAAVLDLTEGSKEVYVEFGWAIGAKKPTLLVSRDRSSRERMPEWVQKRQVYPFAQEAEFAECVNRLLKLLDVPGQRLERWQDDPANESIDFQPEAEIVGLVGASADWPLLVRDARRACSTCEKELRVVHAEKADDDSEMLFKVIRVARQSSHLVLVFSGDYSVDLLLCVAGGVFTHRDWYPTRKGKAKRRLILLNETGRQKRDGIPGLLSAKPEAATVNGGTEAIDRLRLLLDGDAQVRSVRKAKK